MDDPENWKERAGRTYRRWMRWILRNVPAGWRSVVGALLIVGGVFGMLPVLGFWMIPLGIAVIGLDVALIRRRLRRGAKRNGRRGNR